MLPALQIDVRRSGYSTQHIASEGLSGLVDDLKSYVNVSMKDAVQISIIPQAHPFWAEKGMHYLPATLAQQSEFTRLAKEKGLELIWTQEKD